MSAGKGSMFLKYSGRIGDVFDALFLVGIAYRARK